eukprot:4999250-Prymnesium_polylepis.2
MLRLSSDSVATRKSGRLPLGTSALAHVATRRHSSALSFFERKSRPLRMCSPTTNGGRSAAAAPWPPAGWISRRIDGDGTSNVATISAKRPSARPNLAPNAARRPGARCSEWRKEGEPCTVTTASSQSCGESHMRPFIACSHERERVRPALASFGSGAWSDSGESNKSSSAP